MAAPHRNGTGLNQISAEPLALDCFAGCGGMTQGLREAGFRVVGAIEIDSSAAQVFRANHPDVQIWEEDVQAISAKRILKDLGLRKGELDLLGGCPPCQGFSRLRTKNRRGHVPDARNDLIYEFQRLVLEMRPKVVMLENVPSLLEDQRFEDFSEALVADGYEVSSKVLDVASYGVPQRRRRAVVVGSRVGTPVFGSPSLSMRTVRDAISHLGPAGDSGDPLHDLPERRSASVLKRIRKIPHDGGGRESLPPSLVLDCHKATDGFKDVYGRMAWDQSAPTITTGCFNPSKGRFLHPEQDRSVTLREAALLQSFPQTYAFPVEIGKVKIARMIGNALPPAFISSHASAIRGI